MKSRPENKHNSISDTIYEKLFNDIISGKLAPGEKITEQEIAASEGVSRAPVREALKRLSEDRLIVLVPRSGCHICELTSKDVKEIFDIRKRLEGLALEYAFDNLNLDQVRRLKEKFNACLELTNEKLIKEELKLDSQFHAMIFEGCNSEPLQDMLNKIIARVHVFRTRGTHNRENVIQALDTHIDILNAILEHNKKQAQKMLDKHIDISRENAIMTLAAMPGQAD